MDTGLVYEIIDCLPQERTLYYYFKDRYAFYLLGRLLRQRKCEAVRDIRSSSADQLLQKPAVKRFLSAKGNGIVSAQEMMDYWPSGDEEHVETYRLSLGCWGQDYARDYRWQQTSRPGANLVLQLNFNSQHDANFESWTGVDETQFFNSWGHPISTRCKNTLAWARMDVDFQSDTVLIEEIQTDWLREVTWAANYVRRHKDKHAEVEYYGLKLRGRGLLSYQQLEAKRHQRIWAEAMLTASLWFIHEELGIKRVYYHSATTGAVLKNIRHRKPPVSMYTDLPRRFCFEKDREGPGFLHEDKRARRRLKCIKQPRWHKLVL
ncbi:MAG: hypothetical protein AAF542_13240 [Pseudomonadota bacterium]